MNISKNLLSLGLIAVISGISTAQTYTATAGTNGVTDIQSDYSMSTGDGASVSVDVPLEFELPKKVAIAVSPSGSFVLPNNPMFEGITTNWAGSQKSKVLDLSPRANMPYMSKNWVGYVGGIYSNTAISITATGSDFIHESDPNSSFKGWWHFLITQQNDANNRYIDARDDGDSSTTIFPYTATLDETLIADSQSRFGYLHHAYIYLDTVDPTDRAGKYTANTTITVTTL